MRISVNSIPQEMTDGIVIRVDSKIKINCRKLSYIKGVQLVIMAKITGFKSKNDIRIILCKNNRLIEEFGRYYEKTVDKFRKEINIERF